MNDMPTLTTALLDLLHELKDADLRLIVGGGFGIFLRYQDYLRTKPRTLLETWPEPRSTNDLDLFLRAELMLDSKRLESLAEALNRLGYKPLETAKYYQFVKPGPEGGEAGSLKVDVLTGPQQVFKEKGLKTDSRRVRPKPAVVLHAHPVDEALTLEEQLLAVNIEGRRSDGGLGKSEVFLPHSFTFLMMKLFALRDRIHDAEKDFGRHHALDLYAMIAIMTETDLNTSIELRGKHTADAKLMEARAIVVELFANESCLGVLRLKESAYYRSDFQVQEFIKALQDVFS